MNEIEIAFYGFLALLLVTFVVLIWYSRRQNKLAALRKEQYRNEVMSHAAEWGEDVCLKILAGKIGIDMNEDMVRLAWGEPSHTDQHEVTKTTEKIRWVYGRPRKGANYVWFKNGKVTKIKT
jgi:hypothetical protein